MAIFTFFKLNKYKSFEYKPLFYDKDKEEFNERVRRIEQEIGINRPEDFQKIIQRGTMRSYLKTARKKDRYVNLRLLIIVMLLCAVAYYMFFR